MSSCLSACICSATADMVVVAVVAAGTIKSPQTKHNRAKKNRKAINIKKAASFRGVRADLQFSPALLG